VKTCASCHKLDGTWHEIGPNLATIQNRGAEAILANVLDPNREVNPQFLSYFVVTNDGRTLTGMIQAETGTSITLVRADNQSDLVLRSEIESLESTGVSLMPEGLEKDLTPQAMADLIAYLLSVR
jgi:putative heme-binding domain-containing protein